MDNYNKNEGAKEYIRVYLYDGKSNQLIKYDRADTQYETKIDNCGFEDLQLKEDHIKINLYNTAEFITLYNNKTYKVIRREFMPCIPVSLYLYLEEV